MANDINGKLLQVGDEVIVPCIITKIISDDCYYNTTLETRYIMPPGNDKRLLFLNSKQVIKKG